MAARDGEWPQPGLGIRGVAADTRGVAGPPQMRSSVLVRLLPAAWLGVIAS